MKDYTEKDKFKVAQMDRKIVFTTETKVKELQETEIFIPNNNFDFFDFSDLKKKAGQLTYPTGNHLSMFGSLGYLHKFHY